MPTKTFIEAIREGLREEMARDESVIVLGEDVGKKGGVFLATDGLWAEFGDERVIDTPLTESQIIGTSIGASINGLRPVAEIQFADFIFPAFNQLISEAARMRYRSNNGYGLPMTVRAPYGGGVHGALYHSQSVEAFFTHIPGLKVVIPSTPYDAKGLLRSSIRDEDPVLFFEHKKMYRSVRGDVPDGEYTRAARQGGGHPSRHAGHGHRLRADGPLRARGGRSRRRRGDQRRGRRPPDAPAARQGDGPRLASARPASAWSSTRTTGSAATARRSPRSSPRRRSTTSTGRSRGSPGRTCRACRTTTSSRTGSWSTRRRSPTASASSPRTELSGRRDVVADFEAVHDRLRSIILKYRGDLVADEGRARRRWRSRCPASRASPGATSRGRGSARATSATT